MKKRILALVFVLALLMAVFSGCAKTETSAPEPDQQTETSAPQEAEAPAPETPAEPEAEPEAEAETQEPAPEEEPVPEEPEGPANGNPGEVPEIPVTLPITTNGEGFEVFMGMSPAALGYIDDYAKENLVWAELTERTGVNISFNLFHPDQTSTLWSLMQAGGDYSDVLAGQFNYTGGNDQAIEDGVYVDLTDLAPEYAPNYWAKITCNQELFDSISTDNGAIVHLATLYNTYRGPDQGLAIRGDWLDQLGMDVPTTVDDLYQALKGFKDELGATAAMWLPTSCIYQEASLLTAFYGSSGLYNDNGTVKFGMIEEPFKEYLQLLNQWYEEGLIWDDFATYGRQEMFRNTSMIADGSTGFFRTEVSEFQTFARVTEDPNAYFVAVPDLVMNEGDVLSMGRNNPGYLKAANWIITTSCDCPEIVLQFCDYCYTEEGSLLCNYGIEGNTFTFDDNGDPHLTDVVMNNETFDYRVSILMYVVDVGPYVLDSARGTDNYTDEMREAGDIWISTPTDEAFKIPTKAVQTAEEQTESYNVYSDIDTYTSENLIKFVTGELDFDQWDTFVETVKSMNLDRYVELSQIALDRYLEK